MNFRQFVRFLRIYLWLLVVCALIGGGAGVALLRITPKQYSATAQVLFSSDDVAAGANLAYSSQYLLLRMPTYAGLARSRATLQPVIDALHLNSSYPSLAAQVDASTTTGTTLMSISVEQRSAAGAQRVAGAIARSLIALVATHDRVSPAAGQPAATTVAAQLVTSPVRPTSATSPQPKLYIVGGVLLGLLVAFAIGGVFWLRRRWSADDGKAAQPPEDVQAEADETDEAGSLITQLLDPRTTPGPVEPVRPAQLDDATEREFSEFTGLDLAAMDEGPHRFLPRARHALRHD